MGWVVKATTSAALPPGKSQYPFYSRLGGPQGQSGRVRKISPPPGFDPRTVQLVASCNTYSATPPTLLFDSSAICKMMWLLNINVLYCRILNHSRYNCDQATRRTLQKSLLETRSYLILPPIEHVDLLGGISPRVKPSNLYAGHHVNFKNEWHSKSNRPCAFMVCVCSVLSTLYGATYLTLFKFKRY